MTGWDSLLLPKTLSLRASNSGSGCLKVWASWSYSRLALHSALVVGKLLTQSLDRCGFPFRTLERAVAGFWNLEASLPCWNSRVSRPDLTATLAYRLRVNLRSVKFSHFLHYGSRIITYALSPRILLASCMSLGIMVTRLAWIAHKFVSSNRPTR